MKRNYLRADQVNGDYFFIKQTFQAPQQPRNETRMMTELTTMQMMETLANIKKIICYSKVLFKYLEWVFCSSML